MDKLRSHPLWGNILETFLMSEVYKRVYHCQRCSPVKFIKMVLVASLMKFFRNWAEISVSHA
ncbi:MAG: hypothetical protein CL941_02550 [Desulfobacter sp.]|nr:hypothetical protein [Desulfobacter sp.]